MRDNFTDNKAESHEAVFVFLLAEVDTLPPGQVRLVLDWDISQTRSAVAQVGPETKLRECEEVEHLEKLAILELEEHHVLNNFSVHFKLFCS